MTHTNESFAHVNGIDIAYDTFGDSGCPPVVLIMGLSSQMVMWEDDFCEKLADRGYWVIRFDNRDVGRSTKLDALGMPDFRSLLSGSAPNTFYGLSDMALDTLGLLDHLGIGAAHFAGVSMGGMISQVLGIEHPDRVRTLTVIMSTTGNPLLPPPKPEALQVLYKPFPQDKDAYLEYFPDMMRVLNGSVLPLDEKRLREQAELTFRRGVTVMGSARQLAAVYSSGSRKEKLASVTAPTLVIHGGEDPLLLVECGIDVAQSIPGAELKIIPGMGHALNPAVWDEIVASIDRHAGSWEGRQLAQAGAAD